MDRVALKKTVLNLLSKYKYVVLVLTAGIILLAMPSGNREKAQEASLTPTAEQSPDTEQMLGQILSSVEGVGQVRILLTYACGEEMIYQVNSDDTQSSDTTAKREDTVIITDANRNEVGLIRQVNPPVYLGAVVVCKGADSPAVRLAVTEAVSKATGLSSDKISVLKMK